jgi:hypothetical protein
MSYMLVHRPLRIPGVHMGAARLREFAFGALFGAALAAATMAYVHRQPAPALAAPEGLMLEDPAEDAGRHDLSHSITPSTILGPAISNR